MGSCRSAQNPSYAGTVGGAPGIVKLAAPHSQKMAYSEMTARSPSTRPQTVSE